MDDLQAVLSAADTIWALLREEVFHGAPGPFLKDRKDLTLKARSFRVEFRLQSDVLDETGAERTMVVLRFARPDEAMPKCPWAIYFRGHWPEREDRMARMGRMSARKLRDMARPKRATKEGDADQRLILAENIYVMEETLLEDVPAQICLFVCQTELSDDSAVLDWLVRYLNRTFRFRVKSRKDVAAQAASRLITGKWWTEDARAWRKLVA